METHFFQSIRLLMNFKADSVQFNIQLKRFQRSERLKKSILHIFPKISSNKIFSCNTRSKNKKVTKTEKVPSPLSEKVITESRFFIQN